MRKRLPFLLAALVPLLILAGMVADQLRVVTAGRPIRVRVVPVDPMSLFQGEYARLSYEFTSMDQDRLAGLGHSDDLRLKKGDRVWIILRQGTDGLGGIAGLTSSGPPPLTGTDVALRAEVVRYSSWVATAPLPKEHKQKEEPRRMINLTLRTGMESFFVPQGEADRIERTTRSGDVTAELSVLPSGRAAVRKLFIKGQELAF